MPALDDPAMSSGKFGIGQNVPRKEDPTLLTGHGKYTDDLNLDGQLYAYVFRSPYAHAIIKNVDTSAALESPGVHMVVTGKDLVEAGYGTPPCVVPLKSPDGTDIIKTPWMALPADRIRYAGEAVAMVIAETQVQAKDAAELIELDVEELPAVVDMEKAAAPGTEQIWPELTQNNTAVHWEGGKKDETEEAFAKAAHVTKMRLNNNRLVVAPIEPRCSIADYDFEEDRYVFHSCSQGVFGLRNNLAQHVLKVEPEKLRVLTYNVGGSFGMKIYVYPEYLPLLHAAKALRRPVKWTDERSGSFMSDLHGRAMKFDAELALDEDHNFTGVRVKVVGDLGAYISFVGPMMASLNILRNGIGAYKTPTMFVESDLVLTNKTPVAAYRGAGRPDGNYIMENLIDQAARDLGVDKIELRRKNLVPADMMPFTAGNGEAIDSGDFLGTMEKALEVGDVAGFAARRKESESRGKLRGLGVSSFCEVTATPAKEMGGVRFDEDGGVTIVTGTLDYGQGHAGTFAQILNELLGIPFDKVRLLQGDSDQLLTGGGSGGSRSVMSTGNALVVCSEQIIEKGKQLAGHLFETAAADIEFNQGNFSVVGTDREIGILELDKESRKMSNLPDGLEPGLTVELVNDLPDPAYPNGCHVCEVEIDPETGSVLLDRYYTVNDFGVLVNPMLVEGQAQGGVVQGIGQVLWEEAVYDDDGQLLSGSFMDYAMPRANDLPDIGFVSNPSRATTNSLGVKGCGEGGTGGSLPATSCAVQDALHSAGAKPIEIPATPEKVWRALNAAR